MELVTTSATSTLRSIRFDVGFGTTTTAQVAALIPALSGASLHFELRLTDVGKPVVVSVPAP